MKQEIVALNFRPNKVADVEGFDEEAVRADTHAHWRQCLETDFREFLKTPTDSWLRTIVEYALTYQTSALLGKRRKI